MLTCGERVRRDGRAGRLRRTVADSVSVLEPRCGAVPLMLMQNATAQGPLTTAADEHEREWGEHVALESAAR